MCVESVDAVPDGGHVLAYAIGVRLVPGVDDNGRGRVELICDQGLPPDFEGSSVHLRRGVGKAFLQRSRVQSSQHRAVSGRGSDGTPDIRAPLSRYSPWCRPQGVGPRETPKTSHRGEPGGHRPERRHRIAHPHDDEHGRDDTGGKDGDRRQIRRRLDVERQPATHANIVVVLRAIRRAVPPTVRLLAACVASIVMVTGAVAERHSSTHDASASVDPRAGLASSPSIDGEVPVPQIALPTGVGCTRPYIVSPASVPAIVEGRDEAFMAGVRNWLGGRIEPLVPTRGEQFNRVALTSTNRALVDALISDQAFVGRGGEPVFGRALVPVSTAGNVLNEAVAIPFASPSDAARFDNAYIATSCANQFRLNLVTPGGEAPAGAPAVTSRNTAGLAVALSNAVYGHPDAVMAHAVVGDTVFIVIVYTNLQVLGSGDAGVGEAMAAGLAAMGVGYRRNP